MSVGAQEPVELDRAAFLVGELAPPTMWISDVRLLAKYDISSLQCAMHGWFSTQNAR